MLVESENLLQNESKTQCFTVSTGFFTYIDPSLLVVVRSSMFCFGDIPYLTVKLRKNRGNTTPKALEY